VGWIMWLCIHLAFLTGFKNRFITVLQWGLAFVGSSRSERTLTIQQAVARVAIAEAGGQPYLLRITGDESPQGTGSNAS
jgi:NADH dehydrogenase